MTMRIHRIKMSAFGRKAAVLLCALSLTILAGIPFGACSRQSGNNDRAGNEDAAVAAEAVDSVQTAAASDPGDEVTEGIPTVIDFYATWCGPCRAISPLVETLKQNYKGKINFITIDVDLHPDKAMQYQVEAMPTFVFLNSKGVEVNRLVGADPDGLKAATAFLLQE